MTAFEGMVRGCPHSPRAGRAAVSPKCPCSLRCARPRGRRADPLAWALSRESLQCTAAASRAPYQGRMFETVRVESSAATPPPQIDAFPATKTHVPRRYITSVVSKRHIAGDRGDRRVCARHRFCGSVHARRPALALEERPMPRAVHRWLTLEKSTQKRPRGGGPYCAQAANFAMYHATYIDSAVAQGALRTQRRRSPCLRTAERFPFRSCEHPR